MMFMNRYDIEDALERADQHGPAILAEACQLLKDFQEEVDAHSDGWCHWKQPVNAAKNLMEFINTKPCGTREELKKACRPLKNFYTRIGTKAGMHEPEWP